MALTLAAAALVVPLAASADVPRDNLCNQATPRLIAFHDASLSNDLTKIATAAHAAAAVYQTCLSEAKTATIEEPRWNYDRTRAAQFLVVEGRSLAATGDTVGAVKALQAARALAVDVVAWQASSQGFHQSNNGAGYSADRNTDHSGSQYKGNAQQVIAAVDEALSKLGVAIPQASPKP